MFGKKKEDAPFQPPAEIAPGRPFPPIPGDAKDYEVGFFGPHDPLNPHSWSNAKKGRMLFSLAYVIMVATWGSAIGAPALTVIKKVFHLGLPVAALTVSLYVLGFAVGPIVWGPLSTAYGRKLPLFLGSFGMMLFMFAAGSAKDYQTLVLSRFFQGVFGASSLTVGPAMAGDTFSNEARGSAVTLVTFCVIAGPMIAPIVGGYIVQSFLGWRWTQYISGIMAALACILIVFVIPETHDKTILRKKAVHLRSETGNWGIQAQGEFEKVEISLYEILLSPMIMLVQEPILGLITLYHGLIYGILYMCLEAVPIVFSGYNFPGANIFLPYIAILIGAATVCAFNAVVLDVWTNKELVKKNKPVLPENRLVLMIISGGVFVMGIFWMCWAGAYARHVHWIVPMVGGSFIGFGIIGIFIAAFNYILDTYLHRSAMAFAANTFLRSAFGCAFPLFVHPMFINLGTQWAGTLVGCLAALMFPVPILFFIFGARLRSISKYAINLEDMNKEEPEEFKEAA